MHSSILAQERVSSMNRIAASLCKNLTPTLANLTVTLQYLSTKASDQKESALFSNSIYQLQSIAIKLSNIYAITAAETTPFSSVDIAPLLERTTAIFRAIAQKNNIALTVSIPDSLPSIQGDPDQLHLVFNNLVLNAIEAMSPQGGHLWLSARHDAATQLLLVDVEDTGGGIPGEMRATIFKPYQNIQNKAPAWGLACLWRNALSPAMAAASAFSPPLAKAPPLPCGFRVFPTTAPSTEGSHNERHAPRRHQP